MASPPASVDIAAAPTSATPDGRGWSRSERRVAAGQLLLIDQPAAGLAAARSLGFTVLEERRLPALGLGVVRVGLPAGMAPGIGRSLLLQQRPGIIVDYDDLYVPQGSFSLPPSDYARRLVAWGVAGRGCGAGLRLGIIDTQVSTRLPALANAHLQRQSFGPPGADSAHGTAVAAILVGANGIGLLPGATLLAGEIFGRDAAGDTVADAVAFAAALDWLVGQRTQAVNLSLAGHANQLVAAAVQRAAASGTILVAAGGNDGPSAGPAYPAAYPEVMAVAAVDARSNPDPAGNRGRYIAFAAPGVQVWTPSGEGGQFNTGSSFAAPFVTAAVGAALLDGVPEDRRRIEARLAADAVDLGAPGRDPVFGWGLIRARPSCALATASAAP
ncbi:MAG: S8 family serine peptidase [Dongiaceae bacterium]